MSEVSVNNSLKVGYWEDKLAKHNSGGGFYVSRASSVANHPNREQLELEFPVLLAEKILTRTKGKDLNLFKLMLAGLHILLSKYSPRPFSIITSSSLQVQGLETEPGESLVFFSLPYNEEESFRSLLASLHSELEEVLYHQDADFQAGWPEESNDAKLREVLFRTGLFYEPINRPNAQLDTLECLFRIHREQDLFRLQILYHPLLYSPKGIELLCQHFFKVLDQVADNVDIPLGAVHFLTEEDRRLIFEEFNQTERPFPHQTVLEQFEAQAQATPHAIAVKSGELTLTYRDLDERANQVAHHLLETYGIAKGEKVSLMVRRSERIAVGILGILKAGGMYIPIDLSSPPDRVRFMLEDSESRIVLTEPKLIDPEWQLAGIEYVDIDKLYAGSVDRPGICISPDDLVYMIYTSGTTGKPKGAMIYHRSLTNHVSWFKRQFGLSSQDSTILLNSYSFDGCYSYVWATLTSGATLHLPTDTFFDPDQTLQYIKQEKITFLKIVPSTFSMLVNCPTFEEDPMACRSLRIIKQGGEIINVNNLRKFHQVYPDVLLGNHYGPTECTIGSVAHWIDKNSLEEFARQPVIGSPFDNQEILILDQENQLQPIGVPGEICIGGAGVGLGYFKREELTARKFIDHPFKPGKKIYKTGDQGRWLPNGTIEFLGRIDNQVKIRGYRVELDEIAEVLKTHPQVKEALVILSTADDDQEFLCAYIISREPLEPASLNQFLRTRLPEYMAPSYYFHLDKLPLTPNGKVNRAALPQPERSSGNPKIGDEPQTHLEAQILEIWQELLGKTDIGIHDNFFEIGGHSLRATQLVALIHKKWKIRLALREVFFHPTIAALALVLSEKAQDGFTEIPPAPLQAHYPLSNAQRRMWILSKMEKDQTAYNIPHAVTLIGTLDQAAFSQALDKLLQRHEILRTVFKEQDGEPRQFILAPEVLNCRLITKDLRQEKNPDQLARSIAVTEATAVFDLSEGPLLRACLIRLAEQEHVFLFTMHHIISDGWSTRIFANDILRLYDAFRRGDQNPLPPLRIQYKDYTSWQHELLNSEQVAQHRNFWLSQFSGQLPVLDLPIDYPRPKIRRFVGDNQSLILDKAALEKLRHLARQQQASLYMVLLAAVKVLLYRYTGQQDLVVGSPIAGREHTDLRDQIGFYVNTLAIRSFIDGDQSFQKLLNTLKNTVLDAYQHQIYPFDQLVEDLAIERDTGRSPLFDVLVVLQNNETVSESLLETTNLTCLPYEYQTGEASTSKFDLTISFVEEEERLILGVEYRTDLFSPSRMSRFLRHMENVISHIVEWPEMAVNEISYLTRKEKQLVLTEFAGHVRPVPKALTVPVLFERQVQLNPRSVALQDDQVSLTYEDLAEKSDRIAANLQAAYGVAAGDVVAIFMDRSVDFVINMLSILKCGAAYLPIEAKNPFQRALELIQHTRARLVICENENQALEFSSYLPALPNSAVALDPLTEVVYSDPGTTISADSLAYIMFTSGSTGKPKGVMIEHKSIIRLVCQTNYIELTEKTRILQTGSLSFDAATFEIWGALLNGGQVHLVDLYSLLDARRLKAEIATRGITTLFLTTAWLNQLADQDPSVFQPVKELLFGGEKVSPGHVEKIRKHCPELRLIHCYGPTENTTFSICGTVSEPIGYDIPLGFPIANSTVFILDSRLQPVPLGVVGEIFLGGEGLSRGYIYDEERTRKQFIPHPLEAGKFLYRSGDLGRWTEDGQVEFLGRIDDQVKIRGYRVEPGEIANVIRDLDAVQEAIVVVHTMESGEKMLAAYYTADRALPQEEMKSYLSSRLPAYMVPSSLMLLPELPKNKNGKIDRGALPGPENGLEEKFIAPSNERERLLAQLWSQVLHLPEAGISVEANFFELGGHSLKATALSGLILQKLEIELPLAAIFSNPTIRGLARYLAEKDKIVLTSIPAAEKRPYYPLSPAQKRLYILQQFAPESTAYNVPAYFILEKTFNPDKIIALFQQLIDRHESLRTTFDLVEGTPVQIIHPSWKITLEDYLSTSPKEALASFVRPFDLHKGPLFRIGYLEGEQGPVLLFDIHHIITDGLSQQQIREELIQLSMGHSLPLPRLQYKDFTCWLESPAAKQRFLRDQGFWLNQLSGELPVLELPVDFPRQEVRDFAGAEAGFFLTPEETLFLRELAGKKELTLYMVLAAIWTFLLSRLSNQEEVIIGTPINGRWHPDLNGVVGMFVNTLPMRNQVRDEQTVSAFFQEVRKNALAAFEHQTYPLEEMVEHVCPTRDPARNPLFDTMFSLLNREEFGLEADLAHEEEELVFQPSGDAKFDLNLRAADLGERIYFSLSYSTALFREDTIARWVGYIRQIIAQLQKQAAGELLLRNVQLITPAETDFLTKNLNPGGFHYPEQVSLIDLFRQQAAKTPENPALSLEGRQMNYRELDERSNQLAHALLQEGLQAETLVALCLDRSMDMIVAILGVLKAGGAYVPIDPDFPAYRIAYILEDTQAGFLITSKACLESLPPSAGRSLVVLDEDPNFLADFPNHPPNLTLSSKQLAYVLYTSGSTGKPKGVLIEHRSVVHEICAQTINFGISEADRILQVSNYVFDASVEQIFLALLNGATLILVGKQTLFDPDALLKYIVEQEVTYIHATPSLLLGLTPGSHGKLRRVLAGGETCPPALAAAWLPYVDFYNKYGPTETTINSLVFKVTNETSPAEDLPLGKPLGNTRIYILDRQQNLAPTGAVGEVYIGGPGLARGYLNQKELTDERFIISPFDPEERLYRSGDLGRWDQNGRVRFHGRIDYQVKIRGYRVELGEIENAILGFPGIARCAVIDVEAPDGSSRLAAYIVPLGELDKAGLLDYLQSRLPDYMIPSHFQTLAAIPLTPGGKTNRKELPKPAFSPQEQALALPTTPTEISLSRIWKEMLELNQVSVESNFFELGGHSLKAVKGINKIEEVLGVKVSLREFFRLPTIRRLAAYIDEQEKTGLEPIPVATPAPHYPLSHAQKRLYILSKMHRRHTAYNIPYALRLKGDLNLEAFEKALFAVVERHEILRTIFIEVGEQPRQIICPVDAFSLNVDDCRNLPLERALEQAATIAKAEAETIFDLGQGLLVKARLLRISDTDSLFLLTLHHIVFDGWSTEVFLNELAEFYEIFSTGQASTLSPLRIQYKDFAVWQNTLPTREYFNQHQTYWLNRFSGELPILELPTDFPRPKIIQLKGEVREGFLNKRLLDALNEYARTHQASLFMVLLAAVKALLYRYTGQKDIIVGSPVAGRDHVDLSNQIGFYVNTLALRSFVSGTCTFPEFLEEVKTTVLESFEHQAYPFDQLVEELAIERDTGRSPLFDVMVSVRKENKQSRFGSHLRLETFSKEEGDGQITAKFDLSLSAEEREDGLALAVSYRSDLFAGARIERMIRHLENFLQMIMVDHRATLDSITYMNPEERQQVLTNLVGQVQPIAKEDTVHGLFSKTARRFPDKLALADPNKSYTYRELEERSTQLAKYLRAVCRVQVEDVVAVILPRGVDFVVTMLGILKCGAAYLPVEANTPAQRIAELVEYTKARLVIGQQEQQPGELESGIPYLNLSKLDLRLASRADLRLPAVHSHNLAYVMFTSGSTGKPKGVMIEHRGIIRLVCETNYCALTGQERVLQSGSLAFDAATFEIWRPLLHGGELHIANFFSLLDHQELAALIRAKNINLMFFTTSWFNQLVDQDPDLFRPLHTVIFGGEKASSRHLAIFRKHCPSVCLINAYGPTENTTFSMCCEVGDSISEEVPLGYPIQNSLVYILDKQMNPVPIGIPGEIFLGGEGLSRGYIYDPERTARQFIPNPFLPETYLYRSGDLGFWMENGQVGFLGRTDDQVKIRGYRIEPGEVNAVLGGHPAIRESVVLVHTNADQEKKLVAYYIAHQQVSLEAIQAYLASRLPSYMMPSSLMALPALPLNANGKLDRRNLPEPDLTQNQDYIAPAPGLESDLAKLWAQVLNVMKGNLSAKANFFDLGGHSLKAATLARLIRQELGIDLPLATLFAHPSIQTLAAAIKAGDKGGLLLPLNEIPNQTARLYLVPPVVGSATVFRELGSLLGSRQIHCIGLHYPGFSGDERFEETIAAMANTMCREILNREKESPSSPTIHILGYSMGAVVAFEMAQLLEKSGNQVKLILLDRSPGSGAFPGAPLPAQMDDQALSKLLELHFQQQEPISLPPEEGERLIPLLRHNLQLLANYQAPARQIQAQLLALEAKKTGRQGRMRQWQHYTTGAFGHYFVEGDHFSVLSPEHLSELSALIANFLLSDPVPANYTNEVHQQ